MPKHLKPILIALLTLSFIFVFFVPKASALWDPVQAIYNGIATLINIVVMALPAALLALTASFADFALKWSNFVNASIVQTGWTIVRDLINVSFIFILLVIAFGTIFRIQNYSIQKLLPKVIAVALLVNFSKLLCGMIIDGAQVLANFFFTQGTGAGAGGIQIMGVFMNGLALAKIYDASTFGASMLAGAATGGIGFFAPMVINAVMNGAVILIAALVFAVIAGFFIIRILVLWFCVILSPAAFICLVVPNLKKYWDKWWHTFLNYVFFGPAAAFFIYLALLFAQTKSDQTSSFGGDIGDTLSPAIANAGGSAFWQGDNLIYYVLIIGLLIGSVVIGKTLGIAGASATVGFAKAQGDKLKKSTWNATKKAASGTWASSRAGQWVGEKTAVLSDKLAQTPFVKHMVKPGQYLAKQKAAIAEEEKNLEHFSSGDIGKKIASSSGKELAARMAVLAERGDLDNKHFADGDPVMITQKLKSINRAGGNVGDILKHRPDWAEHALNAGIEKYTKIKQEALDRGLSEAEAIQEVKNSVYKSVSAKDASKISSDISDGDLKNFIENGRPVHLQDIALNGSDKLTEKVQNLLPNIQNQKIIKYLQSNLAQDLHGWGYASTGSRLILTPQQAPQQAAQQRQQQQAQAAAQAQNPQQPGTPGAQQQGAKSTIIIP